MGLPDKGIMMLAAQKQMTALEFAEFNDSIPLFKADWSVEKRPNTYLPTKH